METYSDPDEIAELISGMTLDEIDMIADHIDWSSGATYPVLGDDGVCVGTESGNDWHDHDYIIDGSSMFARESRDGEDDDNAADLQSEYRAAGRAAHHNMRIVYSCTEDGDAVTAYRMHDGTIIVETVASGGDAVDRYATVEDLIALDTGDPEDAFGTETAKMGREIKAEEDGSNAV
jgi:hypothetical protein